MVTGEISDKIGREYGIKVHNLQPLRHNHQGWNDNLFFEFTDASGARFVYKEIPKKSHRSNLESVFSELADLRPGSFKLVLPIKNGFGRFVSFVHDVPAVVMPYVEHETLVDQTVPITTAVSVVEEFHSLLRPIKVHQHPRTFSVKLSENLDYLKLTIGQHGFVDRFQEFMATRLPKMELRSGNIHGDLSPFHFWIARDGGICLADFDDVRTDWYAADLFTLAGQYVHMSEGRCEISEADFVEVNRAAQKVIGNFEPRDIRYLMLSLSFRWVASAFPVKTTRAYLDQWLIFVEE